MLAIKPFFLSRKFPERLQAIAFIFLATSILFLAMGPQQFENNPVSILVWLIWWPLFIFQYFLIGRFWCAVCPFGAIGDRVRKYAGLDLNVPYILRRFGPLVIGALLITIVYAEEIFHIQQTPLHTAVLLLTIMTFVILVSVVFKRRTWCRYMCPLGGMGVVYGRAGILQIRGTRSTCRSCTAVKCFRGSRKAEGCPMFEFPRLKDTNAYCIFCGNCLKNCPLDSTRIGFRPPSTELWMLQRPRLGEAYLVVILASVISSVNFMHGFPELHRLFERHMGFAAGFTLFYVLWQNLFLLMMLATSYAASRLNRYSVKMNFSIFSYALIPLILAAHGGHCLMSLFTGGRYLQRYLEIPWSLESVAAAGAHVTQGLQILILLSGFLLSLFATKHISRSFLVRSKRAFASTVPYGIFYLVILIINSWIFVEWTI